MNKMQERIIQHQNDYEGDTLILFNNDKPLSYNIKSIIFDNMLGRKELFEKKM